MVTVDLSNIWGQASLPELLALEPELTSCHSDLLGQGEEQTPPAWLERLPELAPITQAAQAIRELGEVCVVLAPNPHCLGAEGVIRFLGEGTSPEVIFAGSDLSTHHTHRLMNKLENRDFTLIVVSRDGTDLTTAIALRNLRWQLERKHGTQEAARRIFAVTSDGGLMDTAKEQLWQVLPWQERQPFSCLSARWLLPMAVAGIDIEAFVAGALESRDTVTLAAFENPLWLYVAVRELLRRQGLGTEVLATGEPELDGFGKWWQSLWGIGDCLPMTAQIPDLPAWPGSFVTLLRMESPEKPCFIDADWKNRDGFGQLEGKPLDTLAEQTASETMTTLCDAGVPVLTLDCGRPDAHTMGELAGFFGLAGALAELMSRGNKNAP